MRSGILKVLLQLDRCLLRGCYRLLLSQRVNMYLGYPTALLRLSIYVLCLS